MPNTFSPAPDGAVIVAAPSGLEVTLRAVDGEDELFLLDTADRMLPSRRGTALLARCLGGGEQEARALTIGDREALLLQLRRLTIGEAVDAVLRCPATACGAQLDLGVQVAELLVPRYEQLRTRYEMTVDAEDGAYGVAFRLPTSDDLDEGAAIARNDPEAAATAILRRCVLRCERDGRPVTPEALPSSIRSAVAEAMLARDPQAEIELEMRCPTCERRFTALFDVASFITRELEDRAAHLLREVHALALTYGWSEADILRMPAQRRARYLELANESRAVLR